MFSIDSLFNLKQTDHAELFSEVELPWQVLPLIHEYVEYATEGREIDTDVSQAAIIGENVAIGTGTVVEPGVVIHGPAVIGKNCVIRSGAYIRENVIVGDDCIIGHSTELKNCILFNEVAVPHFNYIGDSVLGYKTHFGAGAIISNFKALGSNIKVVTLEKTFDTGLRKFGAIIGDQVEVGVNAVLNPGCIVGKGAIIYPLALIRGVVNPDAIVKVRQKQVLVTKRKVGLDD